MDFIKDNNPKLLKHAENLLDGFPEYVKSSHEDMEVDLSDLDSSAFADSSSREYPINDKKNTYLSYAYYKSAGIDDKDVEGKLKKAAGIYHIGNDLMALDEVFEDKKASKEEISKSFALSVDYGSEDGVRYYYPLTDDVTLEKSARDLSNDFSNMPLEAFRHASKNLVKAAKDLGMDSDSLPDRVKNTGKDGEFNLKAAQVAARQRKSFLGDDAGEVYDEIVKSAAIDSENLNDYVNLFVDMDRINNIEYGRDMLNPYEAMFSGHDKDDMFKAANAYVMVSDAPIPLEEFTKIARDRIEKNFSIQEAEELLETIKIAETEGGVAATAKIVDFPSKTQRQLLGALISD